MKNVFANIGVLAVVVCTASGCTSRSAIANKEEMSRLKPLVVLYTSASSALRHPPQSEDEFKKYIATQKGRLLDMLHVEKPEELFTSERDGQPYVIAYGPTANGKPREVIAYEKVGVNGKRMVGYATGIVSELDEERFREVVPQ
jgi:hypothetical protein